MKNVTFPVTIKEGKSLITFTDANNGTYNESGAVCVSSLADLMVRVESGAAEMMNIITIEAVSFERVSGKHWAHHSAGRFTLTKAEHDEMKAEIIKSGKFEIVKRHGVTFDARKLAELLEVVL